MRGEGRAGQVTEGRDRTEGSEEAAWAAGRGKDGTTERGEEGTVGSRRRNVKGVKGQ